MHRCGLRLMRCYRLPGGRQQRQDSNASDTVSLLAAVETPAEQLRPAKAQVALEARKGQTALNELLAEYEGHPVHIAQTHVRIWPSLTVFVRI